jgi:hypothetical protein
MGWLEDNNWVIEPHRKTDKKFCIIGPAVITIDVDYDDVDQERVDAEAKKIVDILNKHWRD